MFLLLFTVKIAYIQGVNDINQQCLNNLNFSPCCLTCI